MEKLEYIGNLANDIKRLRNKGEAFLTFLKDGILASIGLLIGCFVALKTGVPYNILVPISIVSAIKFSLVEKANIKRIEQEKAYIRLRLNNLCDQLQSIYNIKANTESFLQGLSVTKKLNISLEKPAITIKIGDIKSEDSESTDIYFIPKGSENFAVLNQLTCSRTDHLTDETEILSDHIRLGVGEPQKILVKRRFGEK